MLFAHLVTVVSAVQCAKSVHFSDSGDHAIGSQALLGCTTVTAVTMDNELEYIGVSAFEGCTNLVTISWAANLVEIGEKAFYKCNSVKEITLPSKVKVIKQKAFCDMSSLTKLVFPESVEDIRTLILGNSPLCVMSVTDTGGTAKYEVKNSYYLYTKGCQKLICVVPNSATSTFTLDSRCTEFELHAVPHAKCGPTLTIPNHVIKLAGWAFMGSTTLKKIIIGSNMEFMASTTFLSAGQIQEFQVDANNKNYSSYNGAIYNKDRTKLESYPAAKMDSVFMLPKSIREFGSTPMVKGCPVEKFIFSDNTTTGDYLKITNDQKSLISLDGKMFVRTVTNHRGSAYNVPDGVEVIENGAFSETNIGNIVLPASCHTLKDLSFFESTVPHINIENVKHAIGSIFQGAMVVELNIPGTWESIPSGFAMNPYALETLTINEGVKYIGNNAFYMIPASTIIFPKSLIRIGERAFYGSKIANLNLPDESLDSIGSSAFASNSGIAKLVIPGCVRRVESCAFALCAVLKEVTLMNCETYYATDSFSSGTERQVEVVCVATRRFTHFAEKPVDLIWRVVMAHSVYVLLL